jgi:hypothetical protein
MRRELELVEQNQSSHRSLGNTAAHPNEKYFGPRISIQEEIQEGENWNWSTRINPLSVPDRTEPRTRTENTSAKVSSTGGRIEKRRELKVVYPTAVILHFWRNEISRGEWKVPRSKKESKRTRI